MRRSGSVAGPGTAVGEDSGHAPGGDPGRRHRPGGGRRGPQGPARGRARTSRRRRTTSAPRAGTAPVSCCPTRCSTSCASTTRSCSAPSATRRVPPRHPRARPAAAAALRARPPREPAPGAAVRRRARPAGRRPGDRHGRASARAPRAPTSATAALLRKDTPHEIATEVSVNTAFGVERVVRDAFERAEPPPRRKHLTLVHKTNVLTHAGSLWSRMVEEVSREFPEVTVAYQHVDAASMFFVTDPGRFDVIVTDNLFGDILTDLAAAVTGGIGLAASGNLDVSRRQPEHVRAGARQRAGHRRPGHRRPDRHRAVGRAAARPPRPPRPGPADRRRGRLRPGHPRPHRPRPHRASATGSPPW